VPTFLMGLLPTYAQIGIVAPIALVLARVLQGISVGGEFAGSTSFLVEQAQSGRRGYLASWASCGSLLGTVLGSGLGAALAGALPPDALQAWGWRVPFLFGILVGLAGLYVRRGLEETPAFAAVSQAGAVAGEPVLEAFLHHWRSMVQVFGLMCFFGIGGYTFIAYMPTYLSSVVGLPLARVLVIQTVAMLAWAALLPLAAALSDRVGRKRLVLAGTTAIVVSSYPLFLLISRGSAPAALVGVLLFTPILAISQGPLLAMMAEAFPTRVRYSGFSISYNAGQTVFGGTAPLLATYLVSATGNNLAPSFALIAAAAITFLAALTITDRYRDPLA
jgi:MFS transporter, MHS family, proline/betaine transporter